LSATKKLKKVEPLCDNVSCINRDPIDNGCDKDARTITSDDGNYQTAKNKIKTYRLELRYSAICNATWARTEAPADSIHYLEDRQGNKYGSTIIALDKWNRHYSDMGLGKGVGIRVCAEPPKGNIKCTNFVQL